MFSSTVTDFWRVGAPGGVDVIVDDALPANRALSLLVPDDGGAVLTLTPALAESTGLRGPRVSTGEVTSALESVPMNGADHLFYFPAEGRPGPGSGSRRLGPGDAALFDAFVAAAPEDDLDEAFVELDHWLVVGTLVDGRLASAASMYPWRESTLADLGVITLPEFRGRGLARATVRAIAAHAFELGFEPQYRCQLDNTASIALAASAGLEHFGTWDVIATE